MADGLFAKSSPISLRGCGDFTCYLSEGYATTAHTGRTNAKPCALVLSVCPRNRAPRVYVVADPTLVAHCAPKPGARPTGFLRPECGSATRGRPTFQRRIFVRFIEGHFVAPPPPFYLDSLFPKVQGPTPPFPERRGSVGVSWLQKPAGSNPGLGNTKYALIK